MQTNNRLFDDLSRVASGAINAFGGVKDEVETRMRERVERLASKMDLVTREEFDAVRAMAAKARDEQETLKLKLAELEDVIADLQSKAAKPRTTRKSATGDDAVTAD